jgi:FtsZ-binding cell division protein ZapB
MSEKMTDHPVLAQVKLETKEKVKQHILTIIELDLIVESLTEKQNVVERIKDLIRNA